MALRNGILSPLFTTVRVIAQGVVLLEEHRRRFAADPVALAGFDDFARIAEPGSYSVRFAAGAITTERRARSRLVEGMPTRVMPSPLAAPIEKDPGPYGSVRAPGVTTLLTDPSGEELWESCVAAVVGWRDGRFLLVPSDRPRVRSVTEAALRHRFSYHEEPLLVRDLTTPLLLLNAVAPTAEVAIPGRPAFPTGPRRELEAFLWTTAARPG